MGKKSEQSKRREIQMKNSESRLTQKDKTECTKRGGIEINDNQNRLREEYESKWTTNRNKLRGEVQMKDNILQKE